jgi:hypothetical protein
MWRHCYFCHRSAGYLAYVFPHVYLDAGVNVGVALNYTGARSVAIAAESLQASRSRNYCSPPTRGVRNTSCGWRVQVTRNVSTVWLSLNALGKGT